MEHLIVIGEGAGHAVAFGRGRIAHLRTLGLAYVSQSYEIGDWLIRVKLTPGHEYIHVEGGCALGMDSGVIDLRSSIPWFPEFRLPGLRVPTVVTQRNEAQMTRAIAGAVLDESRRDLLAGPGIAGRVVWGGSSIRGAVTRPGDVARSFMPAVARSSPAADAPWKFAAQDENLLSKKLTGMYCPPSIFTGRCRDWVQAVMGRFLYTDWHNSSTLVAPLTLSLQSGAPPALTAAFHAEGRARAATPPARITTSSGVHRDIQGRHWLFLPGMASDTVDVYQLRSNACGELLRKALTPDAPDWARKLSAADRELIEMYILAYSLPVQETWQALAVPGVMHSADAMGYGWHWSRTGLRADRVINDQFRKGPSGQPGEDNWAMRSTHQQLSMAMGDGGRWSAVVATVAGPYDWAVERGLCVILEPYWGEEGGSWKTTPRYTELFAYRDAVFYVWYRGDALLSASVSLAEVPETGPVGKCDPPDFEDFSINDAGEMYGWFRGRTVGVNGGYAEITQKIAKYWRYTVTVAGQSFSMNPGRMERGRLFEIPGKSESEPSPVILPVDWTGHGAWSAGLTIESYFEGYPPYSYYERRRNGNENIAGWPFFNRIQFEYQVNQFAFTRNYPGRVVIGVARNDAEAVYVQGTSSEVKVDAAYVRGFRSSSNYARVSTFAFRIDGGSTIVGVDHIQYLQGLMQDDGSGGPGVPVPAKTEEKKNDSISLIVTRCEGVSATQEDWQLSPAVWWFDEDIAPETFGTLASAMGQVAVIGKNFGASVGVVGTVPQNPLIIGAT
ncbi:hypothetical protein [Delftia deserti]